MSRLMLFLALVLVATAANNYQERYIYLSEQDNPCNFDRETDFMYLVVTLDGQQVLRRKASGDTDCKINVLIPSRAIMPGTNM